METFTPYSALIGGALIGIAASLLMLLNGRVAGVSSIVRGVVLPRDAGDAAWRLVFLGGLIAGVLIHRWGAGDGLAIRFDVPLAVIAFGGLLVGFGTAVSGGCTSGHGVCGISLLSPRSVVATLTFMAVAVIVVFVRRHVIGG